MAAIAKFNCMLSFIRCVAAITWCKGSLQNVWGKKQNGYYTDTLVKYVFDLRRTCPKTTGGKKVLPAYCPFKSWAGPCNGSSGSWNCKGVEGKFCVAGVFFWGGGIVIDWLVVDELSNWWLLVNCIYYSLGNYGLSIYFFFIDWLLYWFIRSGTVKVLLKIKWLIY